MVKDKKGSRLGFITPDLNPLDQADVDSNPDTHSTETAHLNESHDIENTSFSSAPESPHFSDMNGITSSHKWTYYIKW